METPGEAQYNVYVEWLDKQANMLREFHLTFFEVDGTLQLYDTKNKRVFLKRVAPPEGVRADELFVGNTVTVYSRKMKVTRYSDERTASRFKKTRSRSLCLLPPSMGIERLADVLEGLASAGVEVGRVRSVRFKEADAKELLAAGGSRPSPSATRSLTSGTSVAIELVGADCVETAKELAAAAPGLVVSKSSEAAEKELAVVLDRDDIPSTARFRNCSLLVIKPRLVANGDAVKVLREIASAGFTVSAVRGVRLSLEDASDLLGVYKSIVREYGNWVKDLSSSPCLGLEVIGDDVVNNLRKFCGPYNPEVAQELRPDTLRARYGSTTVFNAVHCTDLATDGPLESKFFFKVVES